MASLPGLGTPAFSAPSSGVSSVVAPETSSNGVSSSSTEQAAQTLDSTQKSVQAIQERLEDGRQTLDDGELVGMRDALARAQSTADSIVLQQEPELTSVRARLKELGTSEGEGTEPEDIEQLRAQLGQRQATLDAQVKLARLLALDAREAQDRIGQLRRARFHAELGRRTQSILTPTFWQDTAKNIGRDSARVRDLSIAIFVATKAVAPRTWVVSLILGVALIAGAARARRALMALAIRHTAPTRLRRSLFALVSIGLYAVVPGLLMVIVSTAVRSATATPLAVNLVLAHATAAAWLAGFVAGLGNALLAARQPSWRLPPIPDPLAITLEKLPFLFALAMALSWLAQRMLEIVNAALGTTVFINAVIALVLNALIGFAAWTLHASLGRLQVQDSRPAPGPGDRHATAQGRTQGGASPTKGPWSALPWLRSGAFLLVAVIAISLGAFLLGFVAFSNLVAQEIIWLSMIAGTAYVLHRVIVDVTDALTRRMRDGVTTHRLNDQQGRLRSQFIVVVSGALRLAVVGLAITLLLLPFGEAPDQWLQRRMGFLTLGFRAGEVTIRPTAILISMGMLFLGLYIVRLVRSWFVNQFLPTTRLDTSMHASTANLLAYLAYFFVGVMAISSLGIGLERMAWIVSALSVGIGFGLQAVVQNFVSGVILVMERPIKVGDWISMDGVEGNVRRISARSTEIELFDRSTMIVPNSEFITKKVRNVTMENPIGLVSLKFNMPLNTNADAVRTIMHEVMAEHDDVLPNPAPSVILDGFTEGSLAFSASCYVSSPRKAGRVRSELMFGILRRLRQADLSLHTPT